MQRNWGFRRFLSTICYHTDSILLTQKQGKSLDFPNPCGNIAGRKNDCTEPGLGI